MATSVYCKQCGGGVGTTDRFCSACGAPIESPEIPVKGAGPEDSRDRSSESGQIVCKACGHQNVRSASFCESCGVVVNVSSGAPSGLTQGKSSSRPTGGATPLNFLQSWRFTMLMVLLLIGTIVVAKLTRQEPSPAPPPHSTRTTEVLKEIENLRQIVDTEPANSDALLRLANLLHDVRFYPKAIEMYERYLRLKPSDPDARVDLGTTYFEIGLADTVMRNEYFSMAKDAMKRALTVRPQHQLAHFNMGIISLHNGESETAVEWFRKCIAIDSTSQAGKRAQQLISQHTLINPS